MLRAAIVPAFALALVASLPAAALAANGSWIAATSMHEARERAVAVPLPDGQVLVAGGENEAGALATAEIYDPSTNTWAPVAPMNEAREGAAAASLPDGDVLVAGGNEAERQTRKAPKSTIPRLPHGHRTGEMLVPREGAARRATARRRCAGRGRR